MTLTSTDSRSGACVVRLDPQGRIVEVNPRLAQTLGRTAVELRGRSFDELLSTTAQRDRMRWVVVVVAPERNGRPLPEITLTKLSAQVLEGVAEGVSTTELAARLHLSPQGVEYHVTTMLRKFEAPNRAALVARAYAAGVLAGGCWPPKVIAEALK